jgi:phosphoribosylpyrophosphate synthetase
VSKNGVTLNRVPAKVYEDAEDRRAKEKAVADSIAQVVADSIAQAVADSIAQAVADSVAQAVADSVAQAVADSIVKANTVDSSGSDGDSIAIPQEVVDLAESVAECIRKAYSAGSLSAIKDCEI